MSTVEELDQACRDAYAKLVTTRELYLAGRVDAPEYLQAKNEYRAAWDAYWAATRPDKGGAQ